VKLSEKYEKLMEFIYGEYDKSNNFHGHGEYASVLVARFQRSSGIRFGEARAQLAAASYLLNQGWIEMVSIDGRRLSGVLDVASRIQPTRMGILHVEDRRSFGKALTRAAGAAAEIIGRGLKGFKGG
jgi:hypothetical protein